MIVEQVCTVCKTRKMASESCIGESHFFCYPEDKRARGVWLLWNKDEAARFAREAERNLDEATRIMREDLASPKLLGLKAAEGQESLGIPMLLYCPMCGGRHIDRGKFATKPHHTHACQHKGCGHVWRPAIIATVGVEFLPGFKDKIATDSEV